ncbi:MAG: lipopolysaccharide biosynthesis protein [Rhodospirillales bacterium]
MTDFKSRFDAKFLSDTAWNYAAFAIMAMTGVILNFFIAGHFGIETLGVFNQIYAIYVVTAQLAVMGLHDSAQKHNAEFLDSPQELAVVSATAIWLAFFFGLTTAVAVFLASGPMGRLAESDSVGRGLALAAPGLLFFALNKVLMGVLNGRRRMKAFAAAQAFRVTVILVSCLAAAAIDLPGYWLGASFTIAEVTLMPWLLWVIRPPVFRFARSPSSRDWIERHFRFGAKALVNGFLAESYIRVDIIMLGIFVSDRDVGIYSFAALFIEGLYQVPSVVRTIANPVLVRLFAAGEKSQIVYFCRRTARLSTAVYIAVTGMVVVAYPYLEPFFPDQLVVQGYPVLWVLAAGLLIYSAFIPLDHALLQAGSPGRQSLLMAANVAANVALNAMLIPLFGIMGAAVATAIAFCISTINLNLAAWHWLDMSRGLLLLPSSRG